MTGGRNTVGVVLMAYGSPATPDAILPYYTDIRRGRPPTDEQLAELTRRYAAIGGLSPLVERTEAQQRAVQAALDALAPGRYDVVLGLKHADPSIESAVDALNARGVAAIVGAVLAPHFSELSVGQYLARVEAAAAGHAIPVTGVRSWAVDSAFVDFLAHDVRARLAAMPTPTRVVFTAHSLPARIVDTGDPYPAELRATAEAVARRLDLGEGHDWEMAWQSASRTPEPWLAPDILTVIERLAGEGAEGVLVCACGFVADHLEILYDLDIQACEVAAQHGLAFGRTTCVNDDTAVMASLAGRVHALAPATTAP